MVAGLGDSPVPLDQNVVKRKPLIVSPTFMEWVADGNAEQIFIGAARTIAGTSSIITIPNNFTLFITSASLNIVCTGVGAPTLRQGSIQIRGDTILAAQVFAIGAANRDSNSFPMPLRISSNEAIELVLSANNARVVATIQGFLLPRKISIR